MADPIHNSLNLLNGLDPAALGNASPGNGLPPAADWFAGSSVVPGSITIDASTATADRGDIDRIVDQILSHIVH